MSPDRVAAILVLKLGWPIENVMALTVGQVNALALAAAEVI
mgnify:CR=1 FL=1